MDSFEFLLLALVVCIVLAIVTNRRFKKKRNLYKAQERDRHQRAKDFVAENLNTEEGQSFLNTMDEINARSLNYHGPNSATADAGLKQFIPDPDTIDKVSYNSSKGPFKEYNETIYVARREDIKKTAKCRFSTGYFFGVSISTTRKC